MSKIFGLGNVNPSLDAGLFREFTDPNMFWLNPDRIAAEWVRDGRFPNFAAANKAAADHVEAECDRLIAAGASVMAETVLSSSKYVERVAAAKRAGMRFGLIYVVLQTPELAVARVATRVAAGGYDVPAEKVAARWRRSLDNLPHFFREADVAFVFDNSDPSGVAAMLLQKTEDGIDARELQQRARHRFFEAELLDALVPGGNVIGLPSRDPSE